MAVDFVIYSSVLRKISGWAAFHAWRLFLAYLWRNLALLAIYSLLMLAPLALLILYLDAAPWVAAISIDLVIQPAISIVVFALLGTWPAAVLAGGDTSLPAAWNCGKRGFLHVAAQILIGLTLLFTLSYLVYFMLTGQWFEQSFDARDAGITNAPDPLPTIAVLPLDILATVMMPTILARARLAATPAR